MKTAPKIEDLRLNNGPVRICWTCDHYARETGRCRRFEEEPPAEFAIAIDACEGWEKDGCPF